MSDDVIHKLTVYKVRDVKIDSINIPSYRLVKKGLWKGNNRSFPYRLFFYSSALRKAAWLRVFEPLNLSLPSKELPKTTVSGFILAITVGKSVFAVTGGVGHIHLRKHLATEHRFGLNLAQKILGLPELRGLSQKDTSGIVDAIDRVFRGLYNPSGDINNLKRVPTHVRGTLQKQNPLQATIGRSIQASDALTVNGRKKFADIITFLIEVDRLWTQRSRKITIPQLEHIGKKTHGPLLAELDARLVQVLADYDAGMTDTLFLDNEDIGYLPDRVIRYELLYSRQSVDADSFQDVFQSVSDGLTNVAADERLSLFYKMRLKVHFDDGMWEVRPLSYFLCGDIEHKNDVYFLNNRQWYRAGQEFIVSVTNELDNIECVEPSRLGLQPWNVSTIAEEKDFNNKHQALMILDRRLVKIGDEKGEIEFCDLLKKSSTGVSLIHVKHATGAALRALFAQGFVSAKLYGESDEFRTVVHKGKFTSKNGGLGPGDLKILANLAKRRRREMTIVFAIFDDTPSHKVRQGATTTSEVLKGTLSLFAKVDLLDRVTNLRSMGYNVAVSRIKPYP